MKSFLKNLPDEVKVSFFVVCAACLCCLVSMFSPATITDDEIKIECGEIWDSDIGDVFFCKFISVINDDITSGVVGATKEQSWNKIALIANTIVANKDLEPRMRVKAAIEAVPQSKGYFKRARKWLLDLEAAKSLLESQEITSESLTWN